MTRIEFWEPAGVYDVPGKVEFPQKFTLHAFDRVIGKRVPMRGPGGQQVGWCTIAGVHVDEGGSGATWTIDMEYSTVAEIVRREPELMAMSFAFREPEDPGRDPLGSGEVRIRWRDGPAVPRPG